MICPSLSNTNPEPKPVGVTSSEDFKTLTLTTPNSERSKISVNERLFSDKSD